MSLKKSLEEEVQKHTYHFSSGTEFNVSDTFPLKQIERYPTKKEACVYLISRIHCNMLNRDITTQQYQSLKGEIRRGNTIGPVHFIRKFVSGQICLRETLNFMIKNASCCSCCRENICNSSNYIKDKYIRYRSL